MGAFFTNLQVRNASTPSVCAAISRLIQSRAYVSPAKTGWVTVYAEATEDQNEKTMCTIAEGLSKMLKTDVLGLLVHDSDIAVYWLYRCGELVDEFNSAPDYFSGDVDEQTRARVRGNAEMLLPLCVDGTTEAQLEEVLHPVDGLPLMAEDVLTELAKLLGIDETRLSLGFKYFDKASEKLLPDAAEFEPICEDAKRKEARPIVKRSAIQPFDTYSVAIGMLTQAWSKQYEQQVKTLSQTLGNKADDMIQQLRDGFDRGARDMWKKCTLPNRPTIDELKVARDQGPETLAALLAQKNPDQLIGIGIIAASVGLEPFLAALLKHGLDPNASNAHGITTLKAAEHHGLNSTIYRLAKNHS